MNRRYTLSETVFIWVRYFRGLLVYFVTAKYLKYRKGYAFAVGDNVTNGREEGVVIEHLYPYHLELYTCRFVMKDGVSYTYSEIASRLERI